LFSEPSVDARRVEGVAHSIDFHHAGRAFPEVHLAFAIACARKPKTADVAAVPNSLETV
jgi:hypothetical protein